MDFPQFSLLPSLRGEFKSEDFIQPHYKESYRLAIDHLVTGGRESYKEFLKGERIGDFLSEEELTFITLNAKQLPPQNQTEEVKDPQDSKSSSGTYWPVHSDVPAPDLDLGWPDIMHGILQTNIDVLFHPPRPNNPTIKEVIRKHIQDARQVVAIVMDMFTDVDIFKETVNACLRGVPVYVLLDESHLKHFLQMAENQDVKIQQLRNMRLRTVRGQDYLCRSGATFHGTMEERFILIDCHTAIYGTYSFTWSYEKINLSMVQVITGHLVKSYDEEFRTLYARSTVPAELHSSEGWSQPNGTHGSSISAFHSDPSIHRKDQLRHTLNTVYRRTCERKQVMRDLEERNFEENRNYLLPSTDNEISIQNQFPSAERMNFLKRHSYAGERQDGGLVENIRPRTSNWNICTNMINGTNNQQIDNRFKVTPRFRCQQSYMASGDQAPSTHQNMPSLENTSKSFMRTWRIESYLKKQDLGFKSSDDDLDQFEPLDKATTFTHGRNRSSLVFRSTIPEKIEPNMNNTSSLALNPPLHHSSMRWNPTAADRIHNAELRQRQSLLALNDCWNTTNNGPGRNSCHTYASLGRTKVAQNTRALGNLSDTWYKRHSVADPRSNTEYIQEYSGHMNGVFSGIQANRCKAHTSAQSGHSTSDLNEEQRSISHHDFNSIVTKKNATPFWQELPSRTMSAAVLDSNNKDLTVKANRTSSHNFLKNSSKKIKSFLNIHEKREDFIGNTVTPNPSTGGSADTLLAEDEGGNHKSTHDSVKSSPGDQTNHMRDDHPKYSKPRFKTNERQCIPQIPQKIMTQKEVEGQGGGSNLEPESSSKAQGYENRPFSRNEPLFLFEKKQPLRPVNNFGIKQSVEKTKSSPKGEAAITRNYSQAATGHQENKLEKFIHRVGNLLTKNK